MDTPQTVSQVLDRYQAECFHKLAPRTQKDYVRHIAIIRKHFGERIAAELRPIDFRDFMNVERGKIHRNRTMAVLSAAFTFAVRRLYWLDRNVLRDVARHETQPRDRYVTDAEYEAFKATAPLRIQLAMDIALLTGQRQGDIISFKWAQLTGGEPSHLVVRQGKTGKRLAIEVTPALEAVLDSCWMLPNRGEYILATEEGTPYTSNGFKSNWQRAMKRATRGYLKRTSKADPGVWIPPVLSSVFTFHDLRGKSASDSGTIDEAYQRLGHTSIAMTRRVYDRGIRKVQPLR